MIIRKARKEDSPIILEHLFLAMEGIIYEFIGIKDAKKAKDFLRHFIENEDNQYSYTNCFVAVSKNEVIGTVNIYDGAKLETLREPIVQYVKKNFGKDFNPEKETQEGEYYIDSIGVSSKHQGKGIGTKLLTFIIETYTTKNEQTIGLLVDEENSNAEKLYLNLGFEYVGNTVLARKKMKHLQVKPKPDTQ